MVNFTTQMIQKAKGAKSARELLELAKTEGIDLTDDESVTYFEQLNPKNGELRDDELTGISGGGCISDLPLYTDYSMVKEFFCTNCFHVYPASGCKVMCYKRQDDVAYCPVCHGEVFPAEEFLHGKV